MPILTRDQQERRQQQRGCADDCLCPACCDDDMDAFLTESGHDVQAADNAAIELRQATRGGGRARAGSGNGSGGRPRRQRPPTDRQLEFIANLFEQRQIPTLQLAQVIAAETYDSKFGPKQASDLIDVLKSFPKRELPREGDPWSRPAGQPEDYLEERRMYRHAGRVYRVQRSQTSGRFYALEQLEDGSTQYAKGVVRLLEPKDRLTLDQAKEWGQRTGVCCECGRTLTNPESIELGIGPVCRGAYA